MAISRSTGNGDTISEMTEPTTTVGAFLRGERERRGIALKAISEQTKISVPLLEGLEADDLARWPGGIFRRAFVRGYAGCVGLDPDDVVRRVEAEHPSQEPDRTVLTPAAATADAVPAAQPAAEMTPRLVTSAPPRPAPRRVRFPRRERILGTAADVTVALVLGLASAAAGSRMLWPVLLIAAYYALGGLLTGTTPMMALLADEAAPEPVRPEAISEVLSRAPSRKVRQENPAREARHEGTPRRRHGRGVTPRAMQS